MADVRLDPWQMIRSVNWPKRDMTLLVIVVEAVVNYGGVSAPSPVNLAPRLTIQGGTAPAGELISSSFTLARIGVVPPAPAIKQEVTPAMLKYFGAWSYTPFKELSPLVFTPAQHFWAISTDGGTFPDFVAAPYGSLADAQAYLDAQVILHPEYNGQEFVISEVNTPQNYAQSANWRQITFINLDAFKKTAGKVEFEFAALTPSFDGRILSFDAMLYRGELIEFTADDENNPGWEEEPDAEFFVTNKDWDVFDGESLIVDLIAPSITGPGGGGGGEG